MHGHDWWEERMTVVGSADVFAEDAVNDFSHTGPGTLAGKFFRQFWLAIFQSRDLEREWSKPIRILSENLTLYRGASGQVYLVGNRCAHRGTQLSTGIVEGEGIRCIYHGWKYDGSGQCVDQPSEPCSFAQDVKIKSYPCREYLGLIFAYMGESDPPPMVSYPHFERDGVLFSHQLIRPINFFQNLENSIDEVHIGFLHVNSPYQGNINNHVPVVSTAETEFGLAQLGERDSGITRATYFHPPTTTSWAQPPTYPEETGWRDMLGFRVPIDDHSHITHTITFAKVPPEKRAAFMEKRKAEWDELSKLRPADEIADDVLAGRMRFKDIPWRGNGADMTRIQDRIALIGQGVIADRSRENLGQADVAIKLLRDIWRREMTALRDGKPTKQWKNTIPQPSSGV
jgi:5,5'-dehydrodivanillate O-demethylase oxygenase subunit